MPNTSRKASIIAIVTIAAIATHLVLRFGFNLAGEVRGVPLDQLPLIAALVVGGVPLVAELLAKLFQRQFGSDLLAGISIVTAALLGEYLAGTLVVLMLSGGEALEAYAVRSASSVLDALARRMPTLGPSQTGRQCDRLGAFGGRGRRLAVQSFLTRSARWMAPWSKAAE